MATEYYDDEQQAALIKHGYDINALPSGVSAARNNPNPTRTWPGKRGIYDDNWKLLRLDDCLLRYWVCNLDGVEIDGHSPSDLDPNGPCMHCGFDWYNQ